jgi:hypothetical protein
MVVSFVGVRVDWRERSVAKRSALWCSRARGASKRVRTLGDELDMQIGADPALA